jgi:hypothetical protein
MTRSHLPDDTSYPQSKLNNFSARGSTFFGIALAGNRRRQTSLPRIDSAILCGIKVEMIPRLKRFAIKYSGA